MPPPAKTPGEIYTAYGDTGAIPQAAAKVQKGGVLVTVGDLTIALPTDRVGGWISKGSKRVPFASATPKR